MNTAFASIWTSALSSTEREPTEIEQLTALVRNPVIQRSIIHGVFETDLENFSTRIRKLMERDTFRILHEIIQVRPPQLNNVFMKAIMEAP